MQKFFLFAFACMAALCAQAKEPKWLLNEKPLSEKHILASSSIDSIVVSKERRNGVIRTWAEKQIEWKPLAELVGDKLLSWYVSENLCFSVNGTFYGRLDKIGEIYVDAAFIDARILETRLPEEEYVRPKYRGQKLIKIELRDSRAVRSSEERDRQQREMYGLSESQAGKAGKSL